MASGHKRQLIVKKNQIRFFDIVLETQKNKMLTSPIVLLLEWYVKNVFEQFFSATKKNKVYFKRLRNSQKRLFAENKL